MLIGYARVSSSEQDTALQLDALHRAGCDRIYEEQRSGAAHVHRPILAEMLESLKKGDVLVVYKIDRLARSLANLLQIINDLEAKGVVFKSLTEPIETSSLTGRMMLQMLGAFAEFERGLIRERCIAGTRAAVARGVKLGRPRKYTEELIQEIARFCRETGCSQRAAAKHFGVSGHTVFNAVHRFGPPPRKYGTKKNGA